MIFLFLCFDSLLVVALSLKRVFCCEATPVVSSSICGVADQVSAQVVCVLHSFCMKMPLARALSGAAVGALTEGTSGPENGSHRLSDRPSPLRVGLCIFGYKTGISTGLAVLGTDINSAP